MELIRDFTKREMEKGSQGSRRIVCRGLMMVKPEKKSAAGQELDQEAK